MGLIAILCGACRSPNVHRSPARNLYERFRKRHTPTRPFRCQDCRWRGWCLPLELQVAVEPSVQAVDLSALDRLLDERPLPRALEPPNRE
jgi:hypothetical protein